MDIMIVDDKPQVAEVLETSLQRQGHRTTVVHSGREALDRIKGGTYDALFLDVSMPGMNGLDVMAEVRRIRPALALLADHAARRSAAPADAASGAAHAAAEHDHQRGVQRQRQPEQSRPSLG